MKTYKAYEAYNENPIDDGGCFRRFIGYALREVKQKCRSLAGGDGYFSIHAGNAWSGKCVYSELR